MTSISSINTTPYSGIVESLRATSGHNAPEMPKQLTQDSSDIDNNKVDLSNYYSNIRSEDLLSNLGRNVAKSTEDLNNAMVSALENGFSVNDAMNIKRAEVAYKANCAIFKSTVELMI